MTTSESEISNIKAQLEKLSLKLQLTSNFALRTSFELGYEADVPLNNIECPICSSNIIQPDRCVKVSADFWHTGKIKRIECPHCDVIFGPLSVINKSAERLSSDYELLYSVYAEGETTEYQKKAFFARNPEKGKNYLNFACGNWSQGTKDLSELGWQVYGYEPHLPDQHPKIMRKFSDLNAFEFDGIFTHNFIEHLQHPLAQFKSWNAMLKVGDKMAHSSACFEWLFDHSNFHLFYFLGRSLSLLAERTGFEILEQVDFESGNIALFTRVVIFRKTRECTEIDQNFSAPFMQDHQHELSDLSAVLAENQFLHSRVKELMELNEAITSSKGWRLVENLRVLKKNIVG